MRDIGTKEFLQLRLYIKITSFFVQFALYVYSLIYRASSSYEGLWLELWRVGVSMTSRLLALTSTLVRHYISGKVTNESSGGDPVV